MATFEITIDDNKIQDLVQSAQGLAALLGPTLSQVLDAEMAEHLEAAPHEQTDRRQGHLFDQYQRSRRTCLSEGAGARLDADGERRSREIYLRRLHAPREEDHHRTLRPCVHPLDRVATL